MKTLFRATVVAAVLVAGALALPVFLGLVVSALSFVAFLILVWFVLKVITNDGPPDPPPSSDPRGR